LPEKIFDGLGKQTIIAEASVVKKESINSETTEIKEKEAASNFNLTGFTKDTKEELNKVVWPSRQQLLSESVAVILMVILVATVIYLVDNLFGWAAGKVF
jgi:preprotein translocase subunit SecE